MTATWLACLLLSASGCASGQTLRPPGGFVQTLGRDHALAGRVWSTALAELTTVDALRSAVARTDFVVLGESHDNRDHHLLQAQLLQDFASTHARPAVGFEMLDEQQGAQLTAPEPTTPDELAQRVAWSRSHWPAFSLYRPVFEVALLAHARIVAAHPSAEHVQHSMDMVSADDARTLKLDTPLPAAQRQAQADEIRAGHCGHAPEAMVIVMQSAQSYKDAFMARALIQAGRSALLIAGRGHARKDRGVPLFLRRQGVAAPLSVAFVEVEDQHVRPSDYDVMAFDYVVFTPRASDEDACERFKRQLEAMHKHALGQQSSTH